MKEASSNSRGLLSTDLKSAALDHSAIPQVKLFMTSKIENRSYLQEGGIAVVDNNGCSGNIDSGFSFYLDV